ncbi:MAG TPA: hypothetical protein DCM67_08890 [Propionibacteriaceae bacterium]|nr:hypothetical protein [Propionibacteriaceae bacterium]
MDRIRSIAVRVPPIARWGVFAIVAPVILSGCAQVAPHSNPTTVPTPTVASVAASVTPTPTPTPTPTATTLYQQLSAKAQKQFKGCLKVTVRPGSSGRCAELVVKKLKKYGFYPWSTSSYITTAGANAILNYQRSRGLDDTATTTEETWAALALNTPAVPKTLPKKCTSGKYKIIICVDQAQRKLFWIKKGKIVKKYPVRLGGWNSHAKTHEWRVFPTADGTWSVFDKQVSPASENYGSGAMPYSTMFHPDMYIHYSPGFHSVGYAQSSHGCVNIGQLSQAQWIFANTPIGTPVYIYSPKQPAATATPTPGPSATASASATPSSLPTS